MLQKEGE